MTALLLAVVLSAPAAWTQFRLNDANNAAVGGSLRVAWRIKTRGPFSSSPAIAGGTLYVGNNAGELFAIDPARGKILWSTRFSNPLMSAPIVSGNLLYVGEGNEISPSNSTPSHPIHVGAPPNALIAVNRSNGAVVWSKTLPGSGMPMPALIGNALVQHNGAGYINAYDPATGSTMWSRNLKAIASMSAIVPFGNDRFATTAVDPNTVSMLAVKDGSTIWQAAFSPIGSGLGDCPAASDGARIYCNYVMPPTAAVPMQTEREAVLRAYAVDVKTGKRAWDVVLEGGQLPKRNEAGIPLLANGMLYMGSSVGPYVHEIDPANGTVRWRFRAHGVVKGGLVESGNAIYFGDLGGYLWAIDSRTGVKIGAIRTHLPFNVASPVIAGQTLIIGTQNGILLAVPLATIRAGKD